MIFFILFYTLFSYLFMFGVYMAKDDDTPFVAVVIAPLSFPVILGAGYVIR